MKRLKLGPVDVSAVAWGTWRVLNEGVALSIDATADLIHAAIDVGVTTLDTAEIYGRYQVEAFLGEVLERHPDLRSKVEIVSKGGIYMPTATGPQVDTKHYDMRGQRLVECVDKSLRLLNIDHLDVFLVHRPDPLTHVDDTAEGLVRLLDDGKIRAAGVSNYTPGQFEALFKATEGRLVTNQVEFSLAETAPMFDGTFDQAQSLAVKPMIWSPLGGGDIFNRQTPLGRRLAPALARIAEKHQVSADAIALSWVHQHPSNPLVIAGTNRKDRLVSQARLVTLERQDWFALLEAARDEPVP